MPWKEKQVSKLYYGIGEVSRLSAKKIKPDASELELPQIAVKQQCTQSAIRFWLQEFGIKINKHTRSENRLFNTEEVRKVLAVVYLLKNEHYTLKGAKIKFNLWQDGLYEIPELYLSLD